MGKIAVFQSSLAEHQAAQSVISEMVVYGFLSAIGVGLVSWGVYALYKKVKS